MIGAGFAKGMSATKEEQLPNEVEDAAKELAGNADLFGEVGDDAN